MTRPFVPFIHGAVCRIHYNQSDGRLPFSNVLHFYTPFGFTGDDLVTLVHAIRDWDSATWKACRSNTLYLTDMYARALDAPDSPAYAESYGSTHPGTWASPVYSATTTKCIKLQSAVAGRSQRGRLFLPPLPVSAIPSSSIVSSVLLTAAVGAINVLIANLHELTPYMELVVASYRNEKIWRTYATMQPVEEAVAVGTRVDSQRRRLGEMNARP